ncbi:GTP-binding protein Parf [Phytophthora cinnamomi]|uniref:GTP-binding protein Parf n=1 Tax=Phytophthora cinnamomi TaxID=4785 RepID=UPI00355A3C4D|nr:GTP-binding protein Parf [Phytophthora cinnamomi]
MIQAVSPPRRVENEMHLGVSSGEEPELAGTEDAVVPTHEQVTTEVSTQESAKQFSNDADASSEPDDTTSAFKENVMEASNAAPTTTEENSLEDSTLRTANTKHGADTKQELMDPSQGSIEDLSNVKETHKALVVGGGDDDEVGLDSNSNELKSFLEDDNDSGENDTSEALPEEDTVADEPVLQVAPACSPAIQRPDVVMSDDESDSNEDKKGGSTSLSLTSLQASLPIPEASPPSTSVAPPSVDAFNQENLLQGQGMGHYHKRNLEESGDLLSLSALQASLPMPGQSVVPLASIAHASGHNEGANEAAVHISDLQTTPSPAPVPDFSTVVPSNDLEAFLNESGSDSEDAAPPSYSEPPANQGKSGRRTVVVESSDDDEDEENDQDRFASYSISKKSRSERRRKQKEDLRQLNAALDKSSGWDGMENDPFTAPATGVAASEASFGTSDVMEAIRKAQEEAMRMLPAASAPVDDDADADSSSSKKRHKHKHKKEHKHKKRESEDGPKENSSKKSSRKSGSSSRSKKRRPHVEDDIE